MKSYGNNKTLEFKTCNSHQRIMRCVWWNPFEKTLYALLKLLLPTQFFFYSHYKTYSIKTAHNLTLPVFRYIIQYAFEGKTFSHVTIHTHLVWHIRYIFIFPQPNQMLCSYFLQPDDTVMAIYHVAISTQLLTKRIVREAASYPVKMS